ncbi:unnamed protein product [Gongylonema pulchrum]|uniref:Secreted protein n=1 Tax=Gongylonema pulchrum TaxID=637853 RepID=A0A183DXS3_9BILA|nr:unnamed protein product [Gongylonema pulchrum]
MNITAMIFAVLIVDVVDFVVPAAVVVYHRMVDMGHKIWAGVLVVLEIGVVAEVHLAARQEPPMEVAMLTMRMDLIDHEVSMDY